MFRVQFGELALDSGFFGMRAHKGRLAERKMMISRVKVKSGVSEVSSSGNLIDLHHFNSIFKFDSGCHLGEVIETA